MEILTYEFPASKTLSRQAHVGVVGSGDLEILLEPSSEARAKLIVRTGSQGFEKTWEALLSRFFTQNDFAANIKINDFGATPGVVSLRLAQALEVSQHHSKHIKA
ncbi:malonate decarboxylase acyl carrier protein [Thalassobacillus devorans]|uniref:Malonate decarboxylase acyl carrier protein n=1 Tax=Thalassobacillus devorans TaxID=279813 RepID=A0ABQ1NRB3_9BACI|nr:malonate decarboxylase subunit delta [Thalassobacillus devorans]NIK28788.1 malonate decarboxylase delta subunit [Thalassobacillus devorans]GGC83530.1 malonate decarboxylase acyl carrier protein [Thalassobacillus devorans]